MENLLATHIHRNGPVNLNHVPPDVSSACNKMIGLGGDFLPGWMAKLCKGAQHIIKELKTTAAAPTTTTTGMSSTKPAMPQFVAVAAVPPSPPTTTNTAQPTTMTPDLVMTLSQTAISFALQFVMGSMFHDDNAEEDVRQSRDALLVEIGTMLCTVLRSTEQLRKDMHHRFDKVERQLERIHADVCYFHEHVYRAHACMQASVWRLCMKVDAISCHLHTIEHMIGAELHALAWHKVHTTIIDVRQWSARFCADPNETSALLQPSHDVLIKWLTRIENMLLAPCALSWLTRAHFTSHAHTRALDQLHFKGVRANDAIGWLTHRRVVQLPLSILLEVVQTYHAVRMMARAAGMLYDVSGTCAARVLASVTNVYISIHDIYAMRKHAMTSVRALITESNELCLRAAREHSAFILQWQSRFRARCKQAASAISTLYAPLDSDAHFVNMYNDEVKWYEHQMLATHASAFHATVEHAAHQLTLEPSTYPLLLIHVKPDKAGLWLSSMPLCVSGQDATVMRDALSCFMRAEALGWGHICFYAHIEAVSPQQQTTDGKIILLAPTLADLIGQCLAVSISISAHWVEADIGVEIATFTTTTAPQQLAPFTHNQWTTFMIRMDDATGLYTSCSPSMSTHILQAHFDHTLHLYVQTMDADARDSMLARLNEHDHAAARAREHARESHLQPFIDAARAQLRWLSLVDYLPTRVIDRMFENANFKSVLKALYEHDARAPIAWSCSAHDAIARLL